MAEKVKRETAIGAVLFLLLICVMLFVYSLSRTVPVPSGPLQSSNGTYSNNLYSYGSYASVPVQLSDPSYLPPGTSSFYVTFGNVSLDVQGEGWVGGGGFGPMNLLGLGNQSETLSVISVPYNSIVTAVSMQVEYATIKVNGASYNVTAPSGVFANIEGGGTSVRPNSSILVSISPSIVAPSSPDAPLQMWYSARTYQTGKTNSFIYAGQRNYVNKSISVQQSQSITINNATISTSGNLTAISIGVSASQQSGVKLESVEVIGPEQFSYNDKKISNISNSYADSLLSTLAQSAAKGSIGTSILNGSSSGNTGNPYSSINASVYSASINVANALGSIISSNFSSLFKLGGPLSSGIKDIGSVALGTSASANSSTNVSVKVHAEINAEIYNSVVASSAVQGNVSTIPFAIGSDGSLTPSWTSGSGGAEISPDGNLRLQYIGEIPFGNATTVSLLNSSSYTIVVMGSGGAYASYVVNATELRAGSG